MAKPIRVCTMSNGHTLYRRQNEAGGQTYYTDECGVGVVIWDTAITSESTLLEAIRQERDRVSQEKNRPHPVRCECGKCGNGHTRPSFGSGPVEERPMTKHGGGPAFPLADTVDCTGAHFGISARDLFALGAMKGMLSHGAADIYEWSRLAAVTYEIADAMLAEREKDSGGG